MKLSYIIVTQNRREALLRTLGILEHTTPLPRSQWEIWVVDNASTDGTVAAVRKRFPEAHVLQRSRNEGVGARSHAFGPARGEFLILLDDDSYPIDTAVADSIDYLQRTPRCGAVVGRCLLPDGGFEACALPTVMLSGAVCLRKKVVEKIGGFRPEFFRKAGEYDFSFRIWEAGWTIERFEDIVYRHDKVMTGRSSELAHRMDIRNNLILIERFFPPHIRRIYRKDWIQRYRAMASQTCHDAAIRRGRNEARLWRLREMITGRSVLSEATLETILQWRHQSRLVSEWAREHQVQRVVIADFAKNLYATYRACQVNQLETVGLVDDALPFRGLRYRGLKVQTLDRMPALEADGVVIANVNPAQIDQKHDAIAEHFDGPILKLWSPRKYRTGLAILTARAS